MRDNRYRCSQSRLEALARLKDLRSGAISASRKGIPINVRDMTYQSAIFQASATFEEYLKQVFDHWLFESRQRSHASSHLPSRVRYAYLGREFSKFFSRFQHEGDEKVLAEKIESKVEIIEFAVGRALIPNHITGSLAYHESKYPSPKNIRKIYSRIGVDNIFGLLSQKMQTDAELRLQSFNDIRTAIAHGFPPGLTIEDVKRSLDDITMFIGALDRLNHSHFSKYFGGGVW